MAKLFDLGKLKTILNKLFEPFSKALGGYEFKDAKVTSQKGGVANVITFKSEVGTLTISLYATNVGTVFKRTVDDINHLTGPDMDRYLNAKTENEEKNKWTTTAQALNHLLGLDLNLDLQKVVLSDDPLPNLSLEAAQKANEGLGRGFLGINLKSITPPVGDPQALSVWKNRAYKQLKYTLKCETNNPKDDVGTVTDQSLTECVNWIFKYVRHLKGDDSNTQMSKKDVHEYEILGWNFVLPILESIQEELGQLYQNKLNSDFRLTNIIDQYNRQAESVKNPEESGIDQKYKTEEGVREMSQFDSKRINIKLQKIQGSEDLDILALQSNYLPGETLDDIDDIINQEEFLNQLTEEPQSFEIAIDDNGFDIEPCEEFESCPCEGLEEVFKYAINFYRNLYIIHWMAKGNDMMKTHLLSEEMYGELIKEIDTLGELLVEKCGTVPSLAFECNYLDETKSYEFQESLSIISTFIQTYIDYIDLTYCNQDSDVQSTLDEWLRYWKKQLNYFVKGQEI